MEKNIARISKEIEKQNLLSKLNLNPNCEYRDICEYCERKCSFKNEGDCSNWRNLKQMDLNALFNGTTDLSRNYLLNFWD